MYTCSLVDSAAHSVPRPSLALPLPPFGMTQMVVSAVETCGPWGPRSPFSPV